MNYVMTVDFKGDYVEARSDGEKSYQTAIMLWTEIKQECLKHNCFKVLGVGNSSKPMPIPDAWDHTTLFNDFEIDYKYTIAWVELNKNAVDSVRFLETILLNRSMIKGKLFDNIAEAKSWLMEN